MCCRIAGGHRTAKRMSADIPALIIMLLHDLIRFVHTQNRQTKWHPDKTDVHPLFGKPVKQGGIGGFLHFASGIEDERISLGRAIEKPAVFRLRDNDRFVGFQRGIG